MKHSIGARQGRKVFELARLLTHSRRFPRATSREKAAVTRGEQTKRFSPFSIESEFSFLAVFRFPLYLWPIWPFGAL
jgi:hypothetical protein